MASVETKANILDTTVETRDFLYFQLPMSLHLHAPEIRDLALQALWSDRDNTRGTCSLLKAESNFSQKKKRMIESAASCQFLGVDDIREKKTAVPKMSVHKSLA